MDEKSGGPVDDFVVEMLRARLQTGVPELDFSIHREHDLAAEFGIQIKTMRRVLLRLEAEGLLRIPEKKGHQSSVRETGELFEAREAIEGMAARLVVRRGLAPADATPLRCLAEKIDRYAMDYQSAICEKEFHRRVVELSGNRILLRMHAMIEPILLGDLRAEHARPRSPRPILKQLHVALVDILLGGSEEDAERMFREHCTKVIYFISSKANDGP